MIIDFHSHIMPAFDDGAKDADMSLQMLGKSLATGVETVVSTSHCYPVSVRDIDKFIDRRAQAYDTLMEEVSKRGVNIPKIVLGCEVHLACDLTRLRGLDRLCIEGTNYMLVEMPSSMWTDETIDRVYKLSISGIKPIIAHTERNIAQNSELLEALYMLDVLFQINAESFGMPVFKKFINNMMKNKLIHIVGTDMHNMTTRRPNMNIAIKAITKRFGTECWDYLMGNAEKILEGEKLTYRELMAFPPKKIFADHLFKTIKK